MTRERTGVMRCIRRLLFKLAFKGLKAEHPAALSYAKEISTGGSIEDELTIERALVLDYWARWIGGGKQ